MEDDIRYQLPFPIDNSVDGDPDILPYFITDVVTGIDVSVRFEPLTEGDQGELQSVAWSEARFRDVWLEWCGEEQTQKLIVSEDEQGRIQGIVRPGNVRRGGIADRALRDSLLETAPFNRQEANPRLYRGVGRALVARMIVESYRQHGGGQLLIRPVTGSLPFYLALGFRSVQQTKYYVLQQTDAIVLLSQCFRFTGE